MKKEVEYLNISPEVVKKIINSLNEEIKNNNDELLELKDTFVSLINNKINSIVLEMNNSNDTSIYDSSNKVIKEGELCIYVNEHRVTKNNEEIFLTPKEFDILYLLSSNKGSVYTKEQIYKAIWKDKYLLDDGTIMGFIRKLRKKIEENPDDPKYILTIWGIGYKFSDKL